jgi:D-alanine-D-alanine ligase
MNIPYNGSNEKSSKICFDKAETKKIVIGEGIDSPKYYHTSSNSCNDHFDFSAEKYVVKPNAQGSSVGFNIVDDISKINDAIDIALDFDRSVLIEEFINGREITVSVLGEESLPVIEIKPKSGVYDYNSKYIIGETDYICPAEMNSIKYRSVQECALKIHKMLSCDVYSRVDFKFFDNKFYFLEINTLPGMTKTSLFPKAAKQHGLSFKKLIEKIIKLSLEK